MSFKIPRQTFKIFLSQIKLYYSEYFKQNSHIQGNETKNNRFDFLKHGNPSHRSISHALTHATTHINLSRYSEGTFANNFNF